MSEEMTIGEVLQNARLAKGYNYNQVEKSTNIRALYLAALEANEYDKLPGEVFTKGMLRTYANFLGLDGDGLVNKYKALTTGKSQKDVASKGIREVENVKMNVQLKEKRDIGAGRDRKGLGIKVSKPEVKIPWREITAGLFVMCLIVIGYALIPKAVAYFNRPKPVPQQEVQQAQPPAEVKTEAKNDTNADVKPESVQQASQASHYGQGATQTPAAAPVQPPVSNVQMPAAAPEQLPAAQAGPQVALPEKAASNAAPVPAVKVQEAAPKVPAAAQETPKVNEKASAPKVANKPIKAK